MVRIRLGERVMFVGNSRDIARRLKDNPIITPADVRPSRDDFEIIGAFNAGAFEYKGRIGLLLRVAERPIQDKKYLSIPIVDAETGRYKIKRFKRNDSALDMSDPRVISYKGELFLTSVSHFRLAWSDDGLNFVVDKRPTIWPKGEYEIYGIEDARVTQIGKVFYITYSAVSDAEVSVAMISTCDWRRFNRCGLILHPFNKDVCLFPVKSRGKYYMLHRPSGVLWQRNWIWLSSSLDLEHWGRPVCLARTRAGRFDSARLGAGAPPIVTKEGFLEIYHGADKNHRYCLGAMLLDRNRPDKIIFRSDKPIMQPIAPYERKGFFGNVVFTDGVIRRGEELMIYYGASDSMTCLALISEEEIFV